MAKLEEEMKKGAIIALQEVSMTWSGPLHSLFQNRDYHFVLHLYGGKHSNYMGVGVAVPNARYEVLGTSIERLSDTKRWPRAPPPARWRRVADAAAGPFVGLWRRLWGWKPPTDPMEYSRRRFNSVVFLRLRDRATGDTFCAATYHMPCAFWSPPVMATHVALALQHVQRKVSPREPRRERGDGGLTWKNKQKASGDEVALVGDFNIKPGDPTYRLITEGRLAEDDPTFPPVPSFDPWDPNAIDYGMASAYKAVLGAEPDFTNFAQIKGGAPFVDTLDYIFVSPGMTPVAVDPLPAREDVGGPLPNADEPSDHIMLGAEIQLA